MRNPRRMLLTDEFIAKHKLSTNPPPPDSLFWKLWNSSMPIPKQTLGTDFLKGIDAGNLDPIKFGAFSISDAYYCFKGTDYYATAAKHAVNPFLKEFLVKKVENYIQYNEQFHTTWYIKDASSILPPDICKEYSAYEAKISSQLDPIYTLVLMLPCEYLWAWLCESMLPVKPGNIYGDWIKGNNDPQVAYAMGNFLDAYVKADPSRINENTAMEIYKKAMEYEYRNFLSATK